MSHTPSTHSHTHTLHQHTHTLIHTQKLVSVAPELEKAAEIVTKVTIGSSTCTLACVYYYSSTIVHVGLG